MRPLPGEHRHGILSPGLSLPGCLQEILYNQTSLTPEHPDFLKEKRYRFSQVGK